MPRKKVGHRVNEKMTGAGAVCRVDDKRCLFMADLFGNVPRHILGILTKPNYAHLGIFILFSKETSACREYTLLSGDTAPHHKVP